VDSIELPFFNFYLKDKGKLKLAEATMFMTGKNEWKKFNQWPPVNLEKRRFYLLENEKLSWDPPQSSGSDFDEFISNPAKPVPYTSDISFKMTKEYMTDDQRFASRRPDVLVYETDILDEDITLAGPLLAHLKVAISGTDADWIVKLIDVYPPGSERNPSTKSGMEMGEYEQMVRSEVIRGRFRNSNEKPEPFIPDKPETINLELMDVLHCFKKGHRIMIQIQSSWFPLVDRNPQTFVDIYRADASVFRKSTHRVYRSTEAASRVDVHVLP
jgi:putative CocE/NonD family hydrolase